MSGFVQSHFLTFSHNLSLLEPDLMFHLHLVFGLSPCGMGVAMVMIVWWLIYNYLCNQCLSPLKLWVWIQFMPIMARCIRFNIMWSSLSVTCYRSLVFSTNKTDRHNITETFLKVALNTINLKPYGLSLFCCIFLVQNNENILC